MATDVIGGIIIGIIFFALVIVLGKLARVKPKYKSRPGGIHYIRRKPGGK